MNRRKAVLRRGTTVEGDRRGGGCVYYHRSWCCACRTAVSAVRRDTRRRKRVRTSNGGRSDDSWRSVWGMRSLACAHSLHGAAGGTHPWAQLGVRGPPCLTIRDDEQEGDAA